MEVKIDSLTVDPEIQLKSRGVNRDTVQDYVIAYTNEAEFPLIVVFDDGKKRYLSAGFHRIEACKFLGYETIEADVRQGTRQDAVVHAAVDNVESGRQMDYAQKREAAQRLDSNTDWPKREIARRLAVGEASIRRWCHHVSASPDADTKPRTVTRNGTTYQMDVSDIGKLAEKNDDESPSISVAEIDAENRAYFWQSKQDNQLLELDPPEEEQEPVPQFYTTTKASQPVAVTIFSSETNEYSTPPQYIDAGRQVMGGIDLDPASNERAQEWINAGTFYTAGDDGLAQTWQGRVWLNPPYGTEKGQSNQGTWAQYLITEYQAGHVTEGILLVKAALGYNWFEDLWIDWPVCFARERISFIKADGSSDGQSKQGTAFFYLGPNVARFVEVFRSFGRVIMPEGDQ